MDIQQELVGPISQVVSDAISNYVSGNGKSLRQLAKFSGVSYSYIRRLAEQEITDEKIDPTKLFPVVTKVKGIDFAYDLINRNQEWSEKIKKWTGFDRELGPKIVENRDLESVILTDEFSTLAFILACNHEGTTTAQLERIGGNSLLKAVSFLADSNIVEINGNSIKTLLVEDSSQFFRFSREGLKKVIPVFVKYYDVTHSGQGRNHIMGITELVSSDFLRECLKKIEDLREWISVNSKKKENLGSNPFFFAMIMDTFTDELLDGKDIMQ